MPPSNNQSVRRGVVYTPREVSDSVCKLVYDKLSGNRVLEPSAGDGSFVQSFLDFGVCSKNITAVDVSKVSSKRLANEFDGISVKTSDFIALANKESSVTYDLILGNPPYIRRHNYTKSQYASIKALSDHIGYPLFQMKNAWAAFLLASTKMLKEDGTLAFILPYEFLTVGYGKYLQDWLVERFKSIDIYIPRTKAFPDIDQDAILVVLSNSELSDPGFFIHYVNTLSDLKSGEKNKVLIDDETDYSIEKKRFLVGDEAANVISELKCKLHKISEYCESATGTVTAANEFFIIGKKKVEEHQLEKWAKPILKKASYLFNSIYFSLENFQELSASEPCYLLDFGRTLFEELDEPAQEYVLLGESKGYQHRYKCRNRDPWYRVPTTEATNGYFFKRSHLVPRLAINKAGVMATDTAYRLTMKPNRSIESLCFSFYNSLTLLFAELEGRFYGGGVLEVTPVEFKALPICYIAPSRSEFQDFEEAFKRHLESPNRTFEFGDRWLKQRLQLSSEQLELIQKALIATRTHRLRHGIRTCPLAHKMA